jgi:Leucine-rich repeat (LRR) protein
MINAATAYKAAKAEIELVRAKGGGSLDLSGEAYNALIWLPDSITQLTALTTLDLSDTQINDLTPIAQLNALKGLRLGNTQVSDLTPIAQLNTLKTLRLDNTQVSDFTPIAQLNALTTLYLSNTQISDLTPIAQLNALKTLDIGNTQVSDLTPIAQLNALKTLDLDNTQVIDLTPIAQLNTLKTLRLENTQVSDLTPIAQLNTLKGLDLGNTQVSDLTPIAQLNALILLDLDNTQVSDLTPISQLNALTTLNLENTQVSDLTPIAQLNALERLRLGNTQVSDLTPITQLNTLKGLHLKNTQVSDLTPIAQLNALTTLNLENTQVSDLTPIAQLNTLKTLNLENTQVSDLRPLIALRLLAEGPTYGGLLFKNTVTTRLDPRIAEIAKIIEPKNRVLELFDYLEGWEPPTNDEAIEAVLRGPVLSESLVDIRKTGEKFEVTTLTDSPSRDKDQDHDDLAQVLSYAAKRMGRTETHNRIGEEIGQSLRDYSEFIESDTINPRILIYLAQTLRAVLSDEMLRASLDGFDKSVLLEFLANHDRLIFTYYANARTAQEFISDTDSDVLQAELFPNLRAARDMVSTADANGLFAPSVSTALEMMHRRAEGARRKIATSGDPEEVNRAVDELRHSAVLITAYLGRIKGRLQQWVNNQVKFAKENPGNATLQAAGLFDLAQKAIAAVTPVFNALWQLIGNLPLPF